MLRIKIQALLMAAWLVIFYLSIAFVAKHSDKPISQKCNASDNAQINDPWGAV